LKGRGSNLKWEGNRKVRAKRWGRGVIFFEWWPCGKTKGGIKVETERKVSVGATRTGNRRKFGDQAEKLKKASVLGGLDLSGRKSTLRSRKA